MNPIKSWRELSWKDAAFILNCGIIGVMAFFCVKTACLAGSTVGSDNFASWLCTKVYQDIFRRSGARRGERAFTRRLFIPSDIKDAAGLCRKLQEGKPPVAAYIRERLSPETRAAMENAGSSAASDALRASLAADLNRLIREGGIYRKERFEGVSLKMETKCLLVLRGLVPQSEFAELGGDKIEEDETSRSCTADDANRKLLEDAFPDEISGVLPGGTIFLNAAPHVKLRYYILAPALWSFAAGALAGCVAVLLYRRGRSEGGESARGGVPGTDSSASYLVPAWLPPVLAALAFLHQGYFWGLVAYVMTWYSAASRPVRAVSRVLAFLASAFWGIGTELDWSGGWSKIYPEANHVMKNIFGLFGISF